MSVVQLSDIPQHLLALVAADQKSNTFPLMSVAAMHIEAEWRARPHLEQPSFCFLLVNLFA
jgi:hypothetical protein